MNPVISQRRLLINSLLTGVAVSLGARWAASSGGLVPGAAR